LTTSSPAPRRGEVWRINFDPTVGTEIQKLRPAVVISSDAIGKLPIKLVAPITGWQPHFAGNVWHVRLDPDSDNGLTKPSAVDVLQVRGVDTRRFVALLGSVSPDVLEEIVTSLALVVEYQ
jgi:mRNA interferase MazF